MKLVNTLPANILLLHCKWQGTDGLVRPWELEFKLHRGSWEHLVPGYQQRGSAQARMSSVHRWCWSQLPYWLLTELQRPFPGHPGWSLEAFHPGVQPSLRWESGPWWWGQHCGLGFCWRQYAVTIEWLHPLVPSIHSVPATSQAETCLTAAIGPHAMELLWNACSSSYTQTPHLGYIQSLGRKWPLLKL